MKYFIYLWSFSGLYISKSNVLGPFPIFLLFFMQEYRIIFSNPRCVLLVALAVIEFRKKNNVIGQPSSLLKVINTSSSNQ